jgi:hypothetical protein
LPVWEREAVDLGGFGGGEQDLAVVDGDGAGEDEEVAGVEGGV